MDSVVVALSSVSSVDVLRCVEVVSGGPHLEDSFAERELSASFTKSVDASAWKLQVQLQVLVHHHEGLVNCAQVSLLVTVALEAELELALVKFKSNHLELLLLHSFRLVEYVRWDGVPWVLGVVESQEGGPVVPLAELEGNVGNHLVVLSLRDNQWISFNDSLVVVQWMQMSLASHLALVRYQESFDRVLVVEDR